MVEYKPTSRRPIAQTFRQTADAATRLCVRSGVQADTISYSSMVSALAAALCFWKSSDYTWLLIVAPLFCLFRLWLNMLDGMVAIAAGQASTRGEILNDLPDRISDVIIFAGAAHSSWMNPIVGYWAAVLALLTAYVGLFGQAIGGQREFSGTMSKPWRMVVLSIGAWCTFVWLWRSNGGFRFNHLTILDWTCVLVIAGCAQTIAVRLKRIMTSLPDRKR